MSQYSTQHIAYLTRAEMDEFSGRLTQPLDPQHLRAPPASSIGLIKVAALGRFWTTDPQQPHPEGQNRQRYRMADVLAGCCAAQIPVIYALISRDNQLHVMLGAVGADPEGEVGPSPSGSLQVLRRSMPGHYPGIDLETLEDDQSGELASWLAQCEYAGLVTGLPSVKSTGEVEDPTQADRLIRTMHESTWALLTVGTPITPQQAHQHLNQVINEMRAVENAEQPKARRSPLAEVYLKLLEKHQKELLLARPTGLWSTTTYYQAQDPDTFLRLGSAIGACYGGEESQIDPIRTVAVPDISQTAARFGQVTVPTVTPPGSFRRPYAFQTLISSQRLAALVHLPRLEVPGYLVRDQVRFDVAPHQPSGKAPITLGRIQDRGQPVSATYRLTLNAINKHVLVVGVTGSGKTNTIFYLLDELWKLGIPFLVLEPAKTEYRALLGHETIGPALQVFTVGDETVAPLRLNPFQTEPGVSVATHIDLLKATFNASFAMWSPLPQVLERCLHEVYRDAGWDPVRNINRRLDNQDEETRESAFPTLTDLSRKVEQVVNQLGYEERITSDIRAALGTRLHSLRIGGKGQMLDTQRSYPLSELLSRPTVIELEPVGDDEEKAFLMGLLLTRLYERYRATGVSEGVGLQHVVVIEEAHRLLANVPQQASEESANARGKAVESFVNMLSEVRAYGQGFFVAEQIPSKLASDVLKNTNLKVVHRTVAGDDRKLLAETMNMTDRQSGMLATLDPGQAAVFAEGDDRPLMVQVPYAKLNAPDGLSTKRDSDRWIGHRMREVWQKDGLDSVFLPFSAHPPATEWPEEAHEFARSLVEYVEFQELFCSLVMVALEAPDRVADATLRLHRYFQSFAPQYALNAVAFRCALLHGGRWYLARFSRRFEWPYRISVQLDLLLTRMLVSIEVTDVTDAVVDPSIVKEFARCYRQACQGRTDPLVGDETIPADRAAVYRYHTEMLLRDRTLTELFDIGMAEAAREDAWHDLQAMDQAVARLGGADLPGPARQGLARAYGYQQIALKPGMLSIARELATARLREALDARYATRASGADEVAFAAAPPTDVVPEGGTDG